MGWLPSFLGGEKSPSPNPVDSDLRNFLNKEAPTKYTPAQAPTPPAQPVQQTKSDTSIPSAPADGSDRSRVPAESLYQDGRYAHLWKTYQPRAQIEAETMTEHDKMMSMLESYKERKESMQQIALENCAEAQEEWRNCMKHGKIEDQLQMCRHQVRRFERCYTMQSRFLRALGYGSIVGRPASVDEDIQMHADALYQRLLAYEADAELAKEEGRPVPVFDPAVPTRPVAKSAPQPSPEQHQKWDAELEKLPETDRIVERAALEADWQSKAELASKVKGLREEEKKAREAEGKPSFGDYLSALWKGAK